MLSPDLSIIIPARNEQFLAPTIDDLVAKSSPSTEIIAILDGYWPERFTEHEKVHYIHNTVPRGMRGAINQGAAMARGKYLMKCDAHCMFAEGFDTVLMADLEPDWITIPRRYSLDPENWARRNKHPHDYLYLCYPNDPNDFGGPSLKGKDWVTKDRDPALREIEIDDLMSAQGSCWFMHKDYFYWLELEDEENYGHFSNEFQEIGLKCWLSGGRVIRNKKTWYAHLHKGQKYGRGWLLRPEVLDKGAAFTNQWMVRKNWHKQDRDIRYMVQKFWPVPTWPEESVRLVFHRRPHGGSGEIRGTQMAEHFKARINPDWHYDFDVNVWVKQEPRHLEWPGKHYLDILDGQERIPWLLKHPECGVIASSQSGLEYLREKLGRDDIMLIPQHHCNYERVRRERDEIKVVGVVGGQGALQCDVEELKRILAQLGLEFRWLSRYSTREEVCEFYRGLDVQIVWRAKVCKRPLKNPLKIINAMSFGVPTIAYPEVSYGEVDGYYYPATDFDEIANIIELFRKGFDAQRLIDKAEPYHIDAVSKLYRGLL